MSNRFLFCLWIFDHSYLCWISNFFRWHSILCWLTRRNLWYVDFFIQLFSIPTLQMRVWCHRSLLVYLILPYLSEGNLSPDLLIFPWDYCRLVFGWSLTQTSILCSLERTQKTNLRPSKNQTLHIQVISVKMKFPAILPGKALLKFWTCQCGTYLEKRLSWGGT